MSSRLSRWMLSSVVAVGLALALGSGAVRAEGGIAGAVASKPYSITVSPVSGSKGQPVKATIVIKPGAGYHMNEEFPTKLKLSPPPGVTPSKAELTRADAVMSKQECRFELTLTASEAGKKTVAGQLSFAVCTETTCDPQKAPVAIELIVK